MPIERELKFHLAPRAAALAERQLATGEAKRVRSIYFDTPERELQHARMALRLRRHGTQWLQTLKCVISPSLRHEWEFPVARRTLELERFPRDEIIAAGGIDLSQLKLEPVFETRFTRRTAEVQTGDAALELALDRGRVIAGKQREPIRELELELKSGAPWTLLRYADSLIEPFGLRLALESKAERGYRLAEGRKLAPPRKWQRPDLADCSPGEALAALAGAALEQVCRNAPGVLQSDDPEYLHQLRVGLRRLRATLSAFKALAPAAEPLKEELRALTPALGAARDWDVFAEALSRRARLWREVVSRQARASREARQVVASPAFNRFLVHALAWMEEAPWVPSEERLPPFAATALERLHRKAMKQGDAIGWNDAAQRHVLRIRVKRLRYACDSFAGVFGSGTVRSYLTGLERLQEGLGRLNDIATGRRLLADIGSHAGRMREVDAAERRLIAGLPRAWKTFARRPGFWKADT
jgi:triphosphatase